MNLYKTEKIGIFVIFCLCFLTHFLYNWFPCYLFSLLFPVNESIWEHMKMIVSSILIWKFLEFLILNVLKIDYKNYFFGVFIMCLLSIIVFLFLYIPIYMFAGESFILSIIILFITICIVSLIDYNILKSANISNEFFIGIFGVIAIYILFGILTYFPPETPIFMDHSNNSYGILKNI